MKTDLALFGTYDTETRKLHGFASSVGDTAYDQRMVYYYVQEHLQLREALSTGAWRIHRRYLGDLALTAAALAFAQRSGAGDTHLVELGSSVLPSRAIKIELFARAFNLAIDINRMRFVGVERSELFRGLSSALAGRYRIEQFTSMEGLPECRDPSVFFTHFVGEYAFDTADRYAEALSRHGMSVIADVFEPIPAPPPADGSGRGDRRALDFPEFVAGCRRRGLQVALLDCYPDFAPRRNAPAVRAKLLVLAPGRSGPTMPQLRAELSGARAGDFLASAREGSDIEAAFRAASALNIDQWRRLQSAKLLHPSWDRAPSTTAREADDVDDFIDLSHPQLDLRIAELSGAGKS